MDKFKVTFVAVLLVLIMGVGELNAQDKPVTVGIKAGVNLSTFGGDIKNTKSTFKYQVGVTADIALTQNLSMLTGLDFQTKGTKYNPKSAPDVKYNPMYLQLPVHLGYKFELIPNVRLVANAGPYAAYGIGGKSKGDGNSEKIFGNNGFKRFDYGIGSGIGLEFGKFLVGGGYDLGLNNISGVKGTKVKTRNAYMNLGYKF